MKVCIIGTRIHLHERRPKKYIPDITKGQKSQLQSEKARKFVCNVHSDPAMVVHCDGCTNRETVQYVSKPYPTTILSNRGARTSRKTDKQKMSDRLQKMSDRLHEYASTERRQKYVREDILPGGT